MAEHAHVVRIARFRPAAGKRDELTSRLKEGAEQIREMDGCFGAQICMARETPDEVVAISRWASQSALDSFLQQSEERRRQLGSMLSGTPTVETLTSV